MKKIPHLRWYILALIFLATVINYLDRQVIAVLAPVLADKHHFNLSDQTLALIFNAFVVAYTIGPTITGWIMDKIGSRRGYVLSMGLWSLAGILTAFAVGIGHGVAGLIPVAIAPVVLGFILCRFLLGVGESANWPAAIKTISEWFPARERSLAVGWFNSGSSLGAVIAPGLVTYLLLHYGWQSAFVAVGCVGYVWISAWLLIYQPLAKHPRVTEQERVYIQGSEEQQQENATKIKWTELLRIPQVRGVVLTRFFMDPIWWFYTLWLPKFLMTDKGIDIKKSAVYLTLSFIASDLGNLFGGWASSSLVKRGHSINRSRKMVMVPCAVLMMLGLVVPFSSNGIMLAMIAVVMFCYQSWSVNMLTIPADVVPKHIVGSAAGLSHMGAGLGGIVVTYLAGYLSDSTGSFTSTILLMGSMPLIGIAFLFFVIGRIAPYKNAKEY